MALYSLLSKAAIRGLAEYLLVSKLYKIITLYNCC